MLLPEHLICPSLANHRLIIATRQHILKSDCGHEPSGVIARCQGVEVRLATLDLGPFPISKFTKEQTALGLDDQIETLSGTDICKNSPVGVVAAQRRRYGEPTRQLCIDFDRAVLLELISEPGLRVRVVHNLLIDRLTARSKQIPEVPCQLLGLEQFLRVIILITDTLVLDPANEQESLRAVDDLSCNLGELLRIAFEVVETSAIDKNTHKAATGQLCLVLQIGEQIGQLDSAVIQRYVGSTILLCCLDAGIADHDVSLVPDKSRPRDWRSFLQPTGAALDELLIVEMHAVCGLVFDAVP